LVDELGKSYKFLTPISPIPILLGKNKCKTALNYIQDNRGENIYNDHLDDDYAILNDKYETYIKYKTRLFSDQFKEHKQNFIQELEKFKQNLVEKVFSTFEYGDSEYCQNIYANAKYKEIVNDIIFNIDKSTNYSGKGKDIFIQNIGNDINKLLENPNVKDDKKTLKDIQLHLSNYLQRRDSTPEQITRYIERVKKHFQTKYGGKKYKKTTKKKKYHKKNKRRYTKKTNK